MSVLPYFGTYLSSGLYSQLVPAFDLNQTFVSLDFSTDIGVSLRFKNGRSVTAFYELYYNGPAIRNVPYQSFADRSIDHIAMLIYKYPVGESLILRPRIEFVQEFYRAGRNENWQTGLYNFWRIGAGNQFEGKNWIIDFSGTFMKFPNYTDLLLLYQAGTSPEQATGKRDQAVFSLWVRKKGIPRLTGRVVLQYYISEKVITSNLSGGSIYSNSPQIDASGEFSAYFLQKLVPQKLNLQFGGLISYFYSNQNFLYFESPFDTSPTFYPGFYNFMCFGIDTTPVLMLNKKLNLWVPIGFKLYLYPSRPAQDANGNYLESGKHYVGILNTALKLGKPKGVGISSWAVVLGFYYNFSSTKFQKIYPYNTGGVYLRFETSYNR